MGYSSQRGRKPIERASKIAHVEIIRNPEVVSFIENCRIPAPADPAEVRTLAVELRLNAPDEVTAVVAIDGGYTETFVREDFPSASIVFFTFGPLLFKLADLRTLDQKRFIAPEDLRTLKQIQRFTLVLPTKGVCRKDQPSLSATVRRTIYDFFRRQIDEQSTLLDSLRWFLFRRWQNKADDAHVEEVARCPWPDCGAEKIPFRYTDDAERTCPGCSRPVYLTDVFRLHERIDEDQGAGGISAYVMTMLEQLVLVHLIYSILVRWKPGLMRNILFIKDGPLAFFGLVAPLCKPMREMLTHLLQGASEPTRPTVRLVGLEKSGAFVEHAAAIQDRLDPGSFLVLGDAYARRYVVPGDVGSTYGGNTYYGQKILFRAPGGEMHVATVPAGAYLAEPTADDIPHVHEILSLVSELRCSMYDNALIPVALANKLVSLADHPSQQILTNFARERVGGRGSKTST